MRRRRNGAHRFPTGFSLPLLPVEPVQLDLDGEGIVRPPEGLPIPGAVVLDRLPPQRPTPTPLVFQPTATPAPSRLTSTVDTALPRVVEGEDEIAASAPLDPDDDDQPTGPIALMIGVGVAAVGVAVVAATIRRSLRLATAVSFPGVYGPAHVTT